MITDGTLTILAAWIEWNARFQREWSDRRIEIDLEVRNLVLVARAPFQKAE
jgi:hypothetical protein